MTYIALTVRKLKPGAYDDFIEAFEGATGGEAPEGWARVYTVRNIADDDEVVSFGFFEGTLDELRASQTDSSDGQSYEDFRASIDPFVESTGADGLYEVVLHKEA